MAVIWRNKKTSITGEGIVINDHQTTRELDVARARYRDQIIPNRIGCNGCGNVPHCGL
jgi:hypothetical protein